MMDGGMIRGRKEDFALLLTACCHSNDGLSRVDLRKLSSEGHVSLQDQFHLLFIPQWLLFLTQMMGKYIVIVLNSTQASLRCVQEDNITKKLV